MPFKNSEKQKRYAKEWRSKNIEKCKKAKREYYERNRQKIYERNKLWRENNRERDCENKKRYNQKIRQLVLKHYGNKCACCGEKRQEFLTIDYVYGGGGIHRRSIGNFYRWIINNNFPFNLQVLCYNCNMAKARYGYCPHRGNDEQE